MNDFLTKVKYFPIFPRIYVKDFLPLNMSVWVFHIKSVDSRRVFLCVGPDNKSMNELQNYFKQKQNAHSLEQFKVIILAETAFIKLLFQMTLINVPQEIFVGSTQTYCFSTQAPNSFKVLQ